MDSQIIMKKRYGATFFLSEKDAERFEAFVRAAGMKKIAVVEKAILEYLDRHDGRGTK